MSSEAIASPAGPPAHAGFLSKRSEWLRIWRKRYFQLYVGAGGPRLYYRTDAESPPHGMIDLRSCLTVKTADEKTGKQHSFEVATGEQVFFMCADTAAQKDEVRRRRRLHPCATLGDPSLVSSSLLLLSLTHPP